MSSSCFEMLNKTITSMSSPGQKSNFAQTCNLLSQYLKERGNFGDISLGITKQEGNKAGFETSWQQPATTMNLLPNLENVSATSSNVKASDFFPEMASFGSSNLMEDAANKPDFRKPATVEQGASPMTIFYGGKVLVFNDFPAEKAMEIMAMANKAAGNPINTSNPGVDKSNSTRAVTPDLNIASSSSETNTIAIQERLIHQFQPPRDSLRRFFEKRKDRAIARAPYQVKSHPVAPPKPEKSTPWLELEGDQPYKQLDLKL